MNQFLTKPTGSKTGPVGSVLNRFGDPDLYILRSHSGSCLPVLSAEISVSKEKLFQKGTVFLSLFMSVLLIIDQSSVQIL